MGFANYSMSQIQAYKHHLLNHDSVGEDKFNVCKHPSLHLSINFVTQVDIYDYLEAAKEELQTNHVETLGVLLAF